MGKKFQKNVQCKTFCFFFAYRRKKVKICKLFRWNLCSGRWV